MAKKKDEEIPAGFDGVDEPTSTDPFGEVEGHTKSFAEVEDVEVALLQGELEEALGTQVRLALQGDTLYVNAGEEFDGRKVRGVITSHDPAPARTTEDYLQDLADGKTLGSAGIEAILRLLVERTSGK